MDKDDTSKQGLTPEALRDAAIIAGFHVEAGTREFAAFSQCMVAEMGESIRPHLPALYKEAVRVVDSAPTKSAPRVGAGATSETPFDPDAFLVELGVISPASTPQMSKAGGGDAQQPIAQHGMRRDEWRPRRMELHHLILLVGLFCFSLAYFLPPWEVDSVISNVARARTGFDFHGHIEYHPLWYHPSNLLEAARIDSGRYVGRLLAIAFLTLSLVQFCPRRRADESEAVFAALPPVYLRDSISPPPEPSSPPGASAPGGDEGSEGSRAEAIEASAQVVRPEWWAEAEAAADFHVREGVLNLGVFRHRLAAELGSAVAPYAEELLEGATRRSQQARRRA